MRPFLYGGCYWCGATDTPLVAYESAGVRAFICMLRRPCEDRIMYRIIDGHVASNSHVATAVMWHDTLRRSTPIEDIRRVFQALERPESCHDGPERTAKER